MKRVKYLTIGTLLSCGIIKTADAVVYIGDPSIDMYKQKTDQTFYDMYQNPQSALGGEVQSNPEAKNFFNSIPTGNRIAEGEYLDRVKQSTIGGGQLPDGASTIIKIFGKNYRLVATAQGIKLYDMNGNLVKSVEISRPTTAWHLVSDTVMEANGIKAIFVPSEGIVYQYDVKFEKTRGKQYYPCGKSTCVRYTPWSSPKIVGITDVFQKRYDLAQAILNGGLVINLSNTAVIEARKPVYAPILRAVDMEISR